MVSIHCLRTQNKGFFFLRRCPRRRQSWPIHRRVGPPVLLFRAHGVPVRGIFVCMASAILSCHRDWPHVSASVPRHNIFVFPVDMICVAFFFTRSLCASTNFCGRACHCWWLEYPPSKVGDGFRAPHGLSQPARYVRLHNGVGRAGFGGLPGISIGV